MDVTELVEEIDDESLKEELETFKHCLVDSEMENGIHGVFNFAVEKLDAHVVPETSKTFGKLKCAKNLKLAFSFLIKNLEEQFGGYNYANKSNTLMERWKLMATTKVCWKLRIC